MLARGPWAPTRRPSAGASGPSSPTTAARPPPTRRSPSWASAARRPTTGSARAWRATSTGPTASSSTCSPSAGRCGSAGDAVDSISSLCVVRDADGRWLAGRRAPWVASWAGRWALGAGGAVEVGENPAETLTRELEEEWSVAPERISAEALIRLPTGLLLFVGLAHLTPGAEVTMDPEHDTHAWWPPEISELARRGRRTAAPDGDDAGRLAAVPGVRFSAPPFAGQPHLNRCPSLEASLHGQYRPERRHHATAAQHRGAGRTLERSPPQEGHLRMAGVRDRLAGYRRRARRRHPEERGQRRRRVRPRGQDARRRLPPATRESVLVQSDGG